MLEPTRRAPVSDRHSAPGYPPPWSHLSVGHPTIGVGQPRRCPCRGQQYILDLLRRPYPMWGVCLLTERCAQTLLNGSCADDLAARGSVIEWRRYSAVPSPLAPHLSQPRQGVKLVPGWFEPIHFQPSAVRTYACQLIAWWLPWLTVSDTSLQGTFMGATAALLYL